jgi:hypothetical protein
MTEAQFVMRFWLGFAVFILLFLGMLLLASAARCQPVDTALVLAADVSSSIDSDEYNLQKQGTYEALTHPQVLEAIRAGGEYGAIAVTYLEWSGKDQQKVLVPWTRISNEEEAQVFGKKLLASDRAFSQFTGMFKAVDFSLDQLEACPFEAVNRVIDISSDGFNNDIMEGMNETIVKERAEDMNVTVNALVIEEQSLVDYYRKTIQTGPGSFVVFVKEFSDFGTALKSKLVKEVAFAH